MNGSALAALIVAAACSSGSSGTVPMSGDDSGSTSSGGSSSGDTSSSGATSSSSSGGTSSSSSGGTSSSSGSTDGGNIVIEASADGGCPVQQNVMLGAHIHFNVSWPSSIASSAGSGPVDIWLLNNAMSTGTGGLMFTGTTKSCGTKLPDIQLNTVGQAAVCAPGHTCGTKVQIQITNATFASISRTFPTSGSQTGWNPGDTLTTNPATGLLGLKSGAQSGGPDYSTAAWPTISGCSSNCTPFGVFNSAYNSDDDGDGNPGITANPISTATNSMYTYPPTTTTFFAIPPLADKVFIVSRNEIELSGMRMGDCTHGTGTAKLHMFDNHVVGCHATATSTDGDVTFSGPAGTCDSAQVGFLDQNRTIYGPQPVPSGCGSPCIASATNPITGTVTVQELALTATCADALNIN